MSKTGTRRLTVEVQFLLDRSADANSGPYDTPHLAATLAEAVRKELLVVFSEGAVSEPTIKVLERRPRGGPL